MSLAPVISPTGIVAPTYQDIFAAFQNAMRSIYGSDIYIDSDSQDGQMIAIFATAVKDNNDAIIAAYNSFSPATAQGVGLSSVVKINGITRLSPTNSQVDLTIVGQAGTVITNGIALDTTNNQWALPDSVTIPIGGSIDVTATAVDAGTIAASPNTITKIGTPTRGWQTVNNAASAIPGLPTESDATLRQRQSVSTAIPATSVIDAILGAILNIIGVGRATIYENATGTTDGNGVPAHSICAVVEGGNLQTIAATIQRYKTPGTGTFGGTSETVVDGLGISYVINFDQLALVDIFVLVYLTPETGFVSPTEALIEGAVAAWLTGLAIGQDSQVSKLWSPVNLTGDAAVNSSAMAQAQLDPLSETYNATAIYQARTNMHTTSAYTAGATAFAMASVANYSDGQAVALQLDDGSFLLSTIASISSLTVTVNGAGIPGGKTAAIGNLLYVAGDVIVAFNEAAAGVVANVDIIT